MDITWHGHACFTVRGKSAAVVIDPFKPEKVKLPRPKLAGDIVLISHGHDDHNNAAGVSGTPAEGGGKNEPYVIDVPGEYESHGVMIEGLSTHHDDQEGADRGPNIVFSITIDGFHLVHLGDLGHQLDDATVEKLGDVDILFAPVGGQYTINAKGAAEVVKKLQPRITVPMHYDVPGLALSKKLDGVDAFLKEVGAKVVPLDKKTWKLKPADLPEEDSRIVVFPNP